MEKTLNVKEINEPLIKKLTDIKYVLLQDKSSGFTFDNMIKAINLFAKNGWRCVTISTHSYGERLGLENLIYALMEKV